MTGKKQTDEEIMVGCAHDGSYVAVSVVRQLMAKARADEREKILPRENAEVETELKKAFEKGKSAGREEASICTKCGEQKSIYGQFYCDDCWEDACSVTLVTEQKERIKSLEAEVSKAKEKYFIERDERLKLEAALEKIAADEHLNVYQVIRIAKEATARVNVDALTKMVEDFNKQEEKTATLEAERTTDTKAMCENAKGMTYWMGEAERYKATLEKVRERLAGFQQEVKCKCEEFDDCYECWVRSEAKDLDKLAKEALGNCGSADGIGCEEQQTTRLSDSKCQRKGSWQPHSKRKNIVSFPTSFGTVSFPKPRKVKKK